MRSEGLRVGDIVWAVMSDDFDGDNGPTKRRRCVVLAVVDQFCSVLAISTKLRLGDQDWHVLARIRTIQKNRVARR